MTETIETRGSGSQTYLSVHGSPSDRRVWEPLIPYAPHDVRLVLLDLPDHGEAPEEPTGRLAPLEDAVVEAVEATDGELTIVGHSLGAWLVASVSSRLPSRVTELIAVCGLPTLDEAGLAMRRELLGALKTGQLTGADVRASMEALFFGDAATPERLRVVAPMLDLSAEKWARLAKRSVELGEREPVAFDRPGRVIHASEDQAVPLALGRDLAKRSGAALQTIETSSHMLPLTHAAQLAQLIF